MRLSLLSQASWQTVGCVHDPGTHKAEYCTVQYLTEVFVQLYGFYGSKVMGTLMMDVCNVCVYVFHQCLAHDFSCSHCLSQVLPAQLTHWLQEFNCPHEIVPQVPYVGFVVSASRCIMCWALFHYVYCVLWVHTTSRAWLSLYCTNCFVWCL